MFLEPHGLPPERGMEHKIILKEGIGPVNVRPYRYPHLLKGEIEKQVEEIMRMGIIRHSTSPILVQSYLSRRKMGVGVSA